MIANGTDRGRCITLAAVTALVLLLPGIALGGDGFGRRAELEEHSLTQDGGRDESQQEAHDAGDAAGSVLGGGDGLIHDSGCSGGPWSRRDRPLRRAARSVTRRRQAWRQGYDCHAARRGSECLL